MSNESSRIATIPVEFATGRAAEVLARIRKIAGRVPNVFAAIGTLRPEALQAVLDADAVLTDGGLCAREREVIKLLVSDAAGSEYCVAAHHVQARMAGTPYEALRQLREGTACADDRLAALAGFLRVLLRSRGTIPLAAFQAVRAAGYTDTQLVDIALVITTVTFTNIFNRINDTELDFPRVA